MKATKQFHDKAMKSIKQLHDTAVGYCQYAIMVIHEGKERKGKRLYRKALSYEIKAAGLLEANLENEPSRSVLYRSAASIALNCEEYETAKKMIEHGLFGFPPPEIRDELISLGVQIQKKLEGEG